MKEHTSEHGNHQIEGREDVLYKQPLRVRPYNRQLLYALDTIHG